MWINKYTNVAVLDYKKMFAVEHYQGATWQIRETSLCEFAIH